MAAPDFYFAVNATFRHLHDRFGKDALVRYWRDLGRDYYAPRWQKWTNNTAALADDWRNYFAKEPGADINVSNTEHEVELNVHVCPAIKHLRENNREIVPYFCEHCDHICGAMAEASGYTFERVGGMGACQQRFVRLSIGGA